MSVVGFIIFVIIVLIIFLGWDETRQILEFIVEKFFEILNAIIVRSDT